MSRRKIQEDEDRPDIPDGVHFKNSLKEFQRLVDKIVVQKKEERLGLYTKDAEEMDYDKFYAAVQALFGPEVKSQDVKTFYRKIGNNPDVQTEWCEIFGYFVVEGDALAAQLDEENMVFLVSKRQRITKKGVKRRDVIKCMVKISQLDFLITASQKGTLSIFNSQMRVMTTTSIPDSPWINGCDYLYQLKRVVAVTERTIIIWDYKSQGSVVDTCFIIKPMEHCLLCVCSVYQPAEQLVKDDILMGDDGGHVNLFTLTSDDFGLKQSKKKAHVQILDSKKFRHIRRKLHEDWVVKVKYIPALNCFGSCSLDSVHSLVLDDLKRLEDNLPVRDFSVPRGVNAFTYCGKANIIVTGGEDKVLRLWHPNINTKPVGKLMGHLFSIMEIVTNEKDQHIISLSSGKIFRVWDIHTLSLMQIFHDTQAGPRDAQIFSMVFDNNHGVLITGSAVIDLYPLTRMIQDTKQVPQTHERNINVLLYNTAFHQVLTICSESIVRIWELESGQLIYQIEDAHGPGIELTCAATDKNGFHLATGACDGTVKTWDFGSGQQLKTLPLAKESIDNEHWLIQMSYLKASESKHVILLLEHSGTIKIVQSNEGEPQLGVTWCLPEALSLALQGNPLMPLRLSPITRKANGFFPDVRLLPEKDPEGADMETPLPPEAKVKCYDVLRVEGYNLLATASANGAIIMWDFESAVARHIFKAAHADETNEPEILGINMLLFLYRSALSVRQLSQSSTYTSESQSDETPIQETEGGGVGGSSVSIKREAVKKEPSIAMNTVESQGLVKLRDSTVLENKGLLKELEDEEHKYIPILASAHEDGCIYLWTIQGDLLREILPFTKLPAIPLTVLCTDISAKMLFAANKEGHVIRWHIGSFLEDPLDTNKHVKQQLCWRAHSTKIVSLFYDEERGLVVTASTDGSVRLWHGSSGYYIGYFGQRRLFELSESADIILPCDVNDLPFTIKEDSKYMEKRQKFEYPLVLDREKWKSLTRSALSFKKPGHLEVDQDFKFFKALASPKIYKSPLESFKSGNKDFGIVFGSIPIYRVVSPTKLKNFPRRRIEPDGSTDSIRSKRSKIMAPSNTGSSTNGSQVVSLHFSAVPAEQGVTAAFVIK
uniref:WD repeat-containing protein 64 n=1 Tax=Euleptes europaea TaxID=460621 RepID=UPI0025412C74|nr:WD repeat-containing protein 64 [Euleptes europaea]